MPLWRPSSIPNKNSFMLASEKTRPSVPGFYILCLTLFLTPCRIMFDGIAFFDTFKLILTKLLNSL